MVALLTSEDLLRMWEGVGSEPFSERSALFVLSVAYPEVPWEELSRMSVGRRDQCLLALRERYVGTHLELVGECPQCHQKNEVSFSVNDLMSAGVGGGEIAEGASPPRRIEHGSMTVEFRLPDSTDLWAVRLVDDVEEARLLLLDRCVLDVRPSDGANQGGRSLPVEVQEAVEKEMERLDPLAAVLVELKCPNCSHGWLTRMDVSGIVVADLVAEARALLNEVSLLGRHYHWSERSILDMNPRRRRLYLELAQA